jgi:colanic acid/amylovoran biosynthesis glycosyltransferase
MKIAYITSLYPSLSHSFILREVLGLRRHGVEVETISIRRTPPEHLLAADDRAEAASTHVVLPPTPVGLVRAFGAAIVNRPRALAGMVRDALATFGSFGPRGALWQLFYVAEAVLVWDWCRKNDVRHVHAHFANVGSDVAMLTARLGGTDRGWSWSFTMHGATEFFDIGAHRLAAKTKDARFVACISDFCRSQLMKMVPREHWGSLEIVHCGVDPDVYRHVVRRRDPGTPMSMLCVGRLVSDKGQALLIEAIPLLAERGIPTTLTLVGDGPDRKALERVARDLGVAELVTFAGAVGQDDIMRYYVEADVFCLPSFAEGVPVVLMEAMATGLPVVSTLIAGIGELVEQGVSGWLARPGRAELLVEALSLLADPDVRNMMGEQGRQRVVASYDAGQQAGILADIFARRLSLDT